MNLKLVTIYFAILLLPQTEASLSNYEIGNVVAYVKRYAGTLNCELMLWTRPLTPDASLEDTRLNILDNYNFPDLQKGTYWNKSLIVREMNKLQFPYLNMLYDFDRDEKLQKEFFGLPSSIITQNVWN